MSINNSGSWEIIKSRSVDTFNRSIHNLQMIIDESGKKFLHMGENLVKIQSVTKEITRLSFELTNLVSDKILKSSIRDLNEVLSTSKILSKEIGSIVLEGENTLRKINSSLENTHEHIGGFNRIVKHLRMLGISTKIESTRLNLYDNGFNALAGNVEILSGTIQDKANILKSKINNLISLTAKTLVKVESIYKEQNEITISLIDQTSITLNDLNKRFTGCHSAISEIKENSGRITENISGIVSSVQFHDITKQQMEHIAEALMKLKSKFQTSVSVDENILEETCDLSILQKAQTLNSKSELVNAIKDILMNIKSVESNILNSFNKVINTLRSENNSLFIESIKKDLYSVSVQIKKALKEGTELSESIKSLAEIIVELSHHVNEIAEIGSEIEIIALNARIKAAHTGNEGAALGVLAESIQRLSLDAEQHSDQFSEWFRIINEFTKNIQNRFEQVFSEINNKLLSETQNKIEELLNSFIAVELEISSELKKIEQLDSRLQKDMSVLISSFNMQEYVENKFEHVEKELEELLVEIQYNYGIKRTKRESTLKNYGVNYTMNSERKIHNEIISGKTEINSEIKNENEFGDNVELF